MALLTASLLAAQWGIARSVQAGPSFPAVTVVVPASDQSIPNSETSFAFSGTAVTSAGRVILSVQYQNNGGGFMTATGTATWNFIVVDLIVGQNQIDVRAIDSPIGGGFPGVGDVVSRTITRLGPGNDPPSLTIVVPPTDETIPNSESTFTFAGTATDPDGDATLDRVEYQVNGGPFTPATGTTAWAFTATGLAVGANQVLVRPVDDMAALGAASTRTITRATGTPTPTPGPPDISFAAASSSEDENAGTVSIAVVLTNTDSADVTVDYAVTGGDATRDSDYVLNDGSLTIPAGSTTASIGVMIIDDSAPELAETVEITLSNASSNASLVQPTVHVLTINQNDQPLPGTMSDFRIDTWKQKTNAKNAAKGSIKLKGEADTNPNAIDLAANGLTFEYDNGTVTDAFPGSIFQAPTRGDKWKIKDPAKQQKGSVLLNIGGSSRTKINVSSKGNFDALTGVAPPLEIDLRSGAFQDDVRIVPTANKKGTSLSFNAKKTPGNFSDPELFVDALLANRVNNKTDKDSVRLTARIPGTPAVDPVNDTFVVNLGFFAITVPPNGWTVKGAKLTFKTPKGSPLGKITVKYNMTKQTISVSAKNQAHGPALTASGSVTVSYGTFARTNTITLQQKANKSGSKDTFRY